ncbi:hypothetical protein CCB81_13030 [Armatimonadetes bacterium Uphvl-Ar2]|nr:hypothetical protein CCB81_00040 [Armatimonadetes bacterium Uphvl-Ar2]ARU45157.1 hypothetical protein CCB81_13030 [Armatimonadetes bacterium Uphvl-Ar2]
MSRTFVRDGSYVTDPVLRDGQATYTPGVSERRGGVSTWSHSGLKNADAQTTSVGAIAATRVHDAFGAELSATGTWKGPFGYAGGFGYQEDSSGLKLLGHRYYDPTTGRFLSRDPIRDGQNWYAYCDSSPLASFDSDGLMVVSIMKKHAEEAFDDSGTVFIGGGSQVIVGVFAFSMHIDAIHELNHGNTALSVNFGFGPALGVYGGGGVEFGYDPNGDVSDEYPAPYKGWATGLSTPAGSIETYDASGDHAWFTPEKALEGWGLNVGPGAGWGVYREKRLGTNFLLATGG